MMSEKFSMTILSASIYANEFSLIKRDIFVLSYTLIKRKMTSKNHDRKKSWHRQTIIKEHVVSCAKKICVCATHITFMQASSINFQHHFPPHSGMVSVFERDCATYASMKK